MIASRLFVVALALVSGPLPAGARPSRVRRRFALMVRRRMDGLLLAYGASFPELWRRAPYFVDRILKGGKPAGARALGFPIHHSLLLRADHVIQ